MKWRHTFQARIAGVLALLLLVVVGAVYFAMKTATYHAVENQAQVQLETGSRVFERLLELRGRRLQYGLDWLTVDSQFRRAVAGGQAAPILAALRRHGTGIRASEVFVLGLGGQVIASTLPAVPQDRAFPYTDALRQARRSALQTLIVTIGGHPFLLVQDEVLDPQPIARVVMGFRMDDIFASELRTMSNLEVSFMSQHDRQPGELFSTQPHAYWAAITGVMQDSRNNSAQNRPAQMSVLGGQRFLNQALQLANTDDRDRNPVQVLLQSPWTIHCNPSRPLMGSFSASPWRRWWCRRWACCSWRGGSRARSIHWCGPPSVSVPVITARRSWCAVGMSSACWPMRSMPCKAALPCASNNWPTTPCMIR